MVEKTSPKKIKDKWKAKEWYKMYAPEMFNKMFIGETLVDDPNKLIGRIREVTFQELTGDLSKSHIKLGFQINNTKGYDAYTRFSWCTMASDYIRRLVRKRKSAIECICRKKTKDGYTIKVSIIGVANKRIQSSKKGKIRHIMEDVVSQTVPESTLSDFVKEVVYGNFGKKLAKSVKVVCPLKKVEIHKCEVLSEMGEIEVPSEEKEKEVEVEGKDVGVAQTGGASDS